MDFRETDLLAVGKIQEARNSTVEAAKQLYRKHVLKLANPDAEDRAEIVLASLERGVELATDDEVEETVAKPQRPTRNERRLARKERQAVKAKSKAKAPRKKAAAKTSTRVECELVQLSKEVELVPTEENHVYTANLFGKKHVALWVELDHAVQGAKSRFGPVDVSQKRLISAKQFAKDKSLPLALCVTVRVGGRLDQGYAVPVALYEKHKSGSKLQLPMSGAARKEYGEQGWAGCKFSAKAAESKAA
jgi:hypothetical protein